MKNSYIKIAALAAILSGLLSGVAFAGSASISASSNTPTMDHQQQLGVSVPSAASISASAWLTGYGFANAIASGSVTYYVQAAPGPDPYGLSNYWTYTSGGTTTKYNFQTSYSGQPLPAGTYNIQANAQNGAASTLTITW